MKKTLILFSVLFIGHLSMAQTLTWATYFGGSGTETGYTATDGAGNIYLAGRTGSSTAIATTGAHQTTIGGTHDAFLAKFSSTGTLLWATYFGGSGIEDGQSLAIDAGGNIYLTGQSTSTTGIATTGAHQTTLGGGSDGYLAKFNSSGVLLWATYFGGSGTDYGSSLTTDGTGNVYLAGRSQSTTGITTTGAHQAVSGGNYDGFLAKFSSAGTLAWATYYGGAGNDYGNGVTTDGSGNVCLAGITQSTTAIATTGAHQTVLGSTSDAFLVKFSSSGSRLWGTYYGGSSTDEGYAVVADGAGNIFMAGQSSSSTAIATSGAYQTVNAGGDGFLVKFNSSGARQWGTYYGGSGVESIRSLAIDPSGRVCLAGTTESTSAIATAGAYQATFGGGMNDGFLAIFDAAGSRLWATYYGGSGDDNGYSVAANGSGYIYLSGVTLSTSAIATTGAHQMVLGGGTDTYLAAFNSAGGIAAITGTATVCVGANTGLSSVTPGGTWSSSSTAIATVGSTGIVTGIAAGVATITYTVGTSFTTRAVTVVAAPVAAISGPASVCVGLTVTLTGATPGGVWTSLYPSIATAGSVTGIVTGITTGTDTIKYKVTNICGTDSARHHLSVITGGSCTTKVKHGKKEMPQANGTAGLIVYPNPNNGSFTMNLGTGIDETVQVIIINITGQKVQEFTFNCNEATDVKLNHPAGVYFIAATCQGETYFAKVVVE